jgi:amino acid permease
MESEDKFSETGSDPVTEKPHFDSPAEAEHGEVKTVQLKRRLQSRHLQMIAIGMY